MSSEEIRKLFLVFFQKKGHKIVPSSSLIPDDPSVLLTTAGMQQFKKYYTGELSALADFGSQRAVSVQKCFRTSDIEEVGDDTHLTFFEMLGNFSFGPVGDDNPENFGSSGYLKRSSIHWAYEFITNILSISPERLTVSIFEGDNEIPKDEESYKIWAEEIGIPNGKIILGKKEDNFWGPTGDEGPCGPSTEIYVDGTEIWNLVFNEYYKDKNKGFIKVKNPGIDTGMGFERLVSVMQGVDNIFKTDIFEKIIFKINELAPHLEEETSRILADHLRSSVFLIADGVRPSNKEAGYILRRLLRRILAYQIKYDIHADLFPELLSVIEEKFSFIYPEIKNTGEILNALEEERQKFQEAISKGLKEIEKYSEYDLYPNKEKLEFRKKYKTSDIADIIFNLYQTYGLPFDITIEFLSKNENIKLDYEGIKEIKKIFDESVLEHQEISRAGAVKKFGGHGLVLNTGELKAQTSQETEVVIRLHTATHLLQWALRQILGDSVKQMGSDINPERLRFDFSFSRKLTSEEIKRIEELVNEKIKENLPVYFKEMLKSEAINSGALHFFKAKYPEAVKVYYIGKENNEISKEFCNGPHVENTAQIGNFKIQKEEAVSAGVRRIRATISI